MPHKSPPSNHAYQEGYTIGNTGMPSSYLPHQYKKNIELQKQWELGWKQGAKDSGIQLTFNRKKIFYWLTIFAVVISILVIINLNTFKSSPASLKKTNLSIESIPSAKTQIPTSILTTPTNNIATLITTTHNTQTSTLPQHSIRVHTTTTQAIISSHHASIEISPTHIFTSSPTPALKTIATPTNNIQGVTTSKKGNTNQFNAAKLISHAVFAKAIIKNTPVDIIDDKTTPINSLFFYSKLQNAIGAIVTHYWYYEGKLISQKTFKEVQGKTWRLHSNQRIHADQLGKWTVIVSDQQNQLYIQKSIIVE